MDTIQTCKHAIAMLEDEQSMTGWSDAHTAALRLAVNFLAYSATGPDAEDSRDAARYRWLRENINGERWDMLFDDCGRNPLDNEALDIAVDSEMARLPAVGAA